MAQIMHRLRRDHANFARLFAALERQIVLMESGGRPDWDIVSRIVQYCLEYPDLYHHPLEDQVFARLRARDPAAASIDLVAEHRELSALLRRVAAAVEQILQDAAMPRDRFAGLVRRFLDAQRDHVRREEALFYPAAERALGPADWAELDRAVSAVAIDPLFSEPTGRPYRSLMSDIRAGEAAEG